MAADGGLGPAVHRAAARARRAGHEPGRARRGHQRPRAADRQRARGREDPRHRARRVRRERRDRRHGVGPDPSRRGRPRRRASRSTGSRCSTAAATCSTSSGRHAAGDPERLGGARPARDRGDRRGVRRPRCSTSTPTLTTIAACSRSPATPGSLAGAVLSGAREAVRRIDLDRHEGIHPRVGAIDVAPIVYLDPARAGSRLRRGAGARRPARRGARPARVPLRRAGGRAHARRAPARRPGGGWPSGSTPASCAPTSGRVACTRAAGAVLVAARPPLIAFNVELAPPATRRGRPGDRGADPRGRPGGARGRPRDRAVARRARRRAGLHQRRGPPTPCRWRGWSRRSRVTPRRAAAELVGLAPRAAFEGFPDDLPVAQPAHGRGRAGRLAL